MTSCNSTRRRSINDCESRPERNRCWTKYRDLLATIDPFAADRLEAATHEFVESNGIKIGDIVHAVRVAITGKAVGFGLFETLAILGRERCLARIERALKLAAEPMAGKA